MNTIKYKNFNIELLRIKHRFFKYDYKVIPISPAAKYRLHISRKCKIFNAPTTYQTKIDAISDAVMRINEITTPKWPYK